MSLVLRAVEIDGQARWRWLLTDGSGRAVTDHEVTLDSGSAEYEAFTDLYGYVRRNRQPHDRVGSEAEIVARVGRWVGTQVFGPVGGHLAGTVQVTIPPEAGFLLARPLELAHVDGQPLARRGVTLVYSLPDERPLAKLPVGDRLRILALFSLPARESVLALRRERYELARTVREIAGRHGKAIELRVLQYGVTRKVLSETVEEYPGWDLLHVSGHGETGVVLLETSDGSPDPVSTEDLVELLGPARERLKLAVLSTCNSGAEAAAASLRALHLDAAAEQVEADEARAGGGTVAPVSLARGLVDRLGVAVVAMRYPVVDTFAVALSGELYPRLLGAGQPVDKALGLAVPRAAGSLPSAGRPALSIGTPALFGASAAGLRVAPPDGAVVLDPSVERMAWFPNEPRRFVGRTQALIAASEALAPDSGRAGVLFVGMAGAGKTACALELAYQHRGRFKALAWWQAPTQPDEFGQALSGLVHALEVQLGIPMMQAVSSERALRAYLPRLRALLRDEGVLLVLDNLETLLSDARHWRDPMWSLLVDALVGHDGLSRVVLTSRVVPIGLDTTQVLNMPTHALSLSESILLARELPNLGRLLHNEPTPPSTQVTADRELVRRVLAVVQGHPKLLELADAAAADPGRLADQLTAAEAGGGDAPLEAFFTRGTSELEAGQFLAVLGAWTTAALHGLPEPARELAELLACVEDDDRLSFVVDSVWPHWWTGRHGGDPPSPAAAAESLARAAIVECEPTDHDDPESPMVYRLHPGVANAIRAAVSGQDATAADELLAAFWRAADEGADHLERTGAPASTVIVRAGLSAAPYLIRLGRREKATVLLNRAEYRDQSPGTIQRVFHYLSQIRHAEADPSLRLAHDASYARLLANVDWSAAESLLRRALADARNRGEPRVAAAIAGNLAELLRTRGDLAAALTAITEAVELAQATDVDRWGQWLAEDVRLRILLGMGRHEEVLATATAMLDQLPATPPEAAPSEVPAWWRIRESVLETAYAGAFESRDWQRALDLNRQLVASRRQRGASAHDQASAQFNASFPLQQMGEHDKAEQVLLACQQVFEDVGDFPLLGAVFGGRAGIEGVRGRLDSAIALGSAALRYSYRRPEPHGLAVSHHNLASFLGPTGRGAEAVAHRLAAALLCRATGRTGHYDVTVHALAHDVRDLGEGSLPFDVDQLTARVEAVPGVRFGEVFANLVPDPQDRATLLAEILDAAGSVRPAR